VHGGGITLLSRLPDDVAISNRQQRLAELNAWQPPEPDEWLPAPLPSDVDDPGLVRKHYAYLAEHLVALLHTPVPSVFEATPESLTDVDFHFWSQNFPEVFQRKNIDASAVPAVGAYLGEVLVRHLGGGGFVRPPEAPGGRGPGPSAGGAGRGPKCECEPGPGERAHGGAAEEGSGPPPSGCAPASGDASFSHGVRGDSHAHGVRAPQVLERWKLSLLNRPGALWQVLTELHESGKRQQKAGEAMPVHDAITYLENHVVLAPLRSYVQAAA